MHVGDFRLVLQRGAGRDGVSFRAEDVRDGRVVELRLLGPARSDGERWTVLTRRLRTAALLDHPGVVRVVELGLDHDPPFVALSGEETIPLVTAWRDRVPLPVADALTLARDLTSALAAVHRVGLTHGHLGQVPVAGTEVKLDVTGLDVGVGPVARAVDPAEDVAALGHLLEWCLAGDRASTGRAQEATLPGDFGVPLARLTQAMTAPDAADRPTIPEVVEQLRRIGTTLETTAVSELSAVASTRVADGGLVQPGPADELAGRQRIGRYRLVRRLGQGGMGTVYQGEDPADGRPVAIKTLRAQLTQNQAALRRFHKEARLLAEVNNPYVANLLEVNEDEGIHYLVLEFVAGRDLANLLEERRRLDERTALGIVADVCRGLAEAHQRGIVHRDIKPENILLADVVPPHPNPPPQGGREQDSSSPLVGEEPGVGGGSPRVKLSDFGLARHIDESESLHVTQAGSILGTPLYMPPEQGRGLPLDARADVYSLGATLFHLLAGRPPFLGDSPLAVISLHANEPPPSLRSLNGEVSDGVCRIVEKCLAKHPDGRYPDADALLRDLERLLRGEPSSADAHPKLPPCDARKVIRYDWSWDLEASAEQLWPLVCNTERFNRAVGLPAVRYTTRTEPDGKVRRFGEFRKAGITAAWEEFPFEWVEGRRFGVLRQYTSGPFKWMVGTFEMEPRSGGGTRLTTRVRIEPGGLLGRTVAAVEVGVNGRRAMDRVYRRFDAALTGQLGDGALVDPFEEPPAQSGGRRRRLDTLLDRLGTAGVEPAVVERLGDFLATAPPQEVTRIRPLALARRLALNPDQVLAAGLLGARLGLLVLLWDILCPVCRIPSEVKDSLKSLGDHGRCDACNLDYQLDFANSVEMIFRAHPEVREADLGVYCVGGPVHSPHVAAQVRVAAGELFELELSLAEGHYRLRGPQLPFALDYRVQPESGPTRWDVPLPGGPDREVRILRAGRQTLALDNRHDRELVVRVERTAPRADALTAARASTLSLFRDLFPGEVLSSGQLVSVATVTLLVADLEDGGRLYRDLGDAKAFGILREYFRRAAERVKAEGGAVIKTVGEKVVAAFAEPLSAVRVALDLQGVLNASETTRGLRSRLAVHRGPAMAATLNDHLDYFGTTANAALRLPELGVGGDVILSQEVASDPQVAELLHARGLTGDLIATDLAGVGLGLAHRVRRGKESAGA